MQLNNNALAVIALANEYCQAIETAGEFTPHDFAAKMVRLLPRIYMAVTDLPIVDSFDPEYGFDAVHLDENYYDEVRANIAATLGSHDTYLETFCEDMKYSDTPIAASVSEGLADIFQVLYDFVEDVRHADADQTTEHLAELRSQFAEFWSQTLCNVLRPLNELYHNPDDVDADE
jgi:hypothetical protein